MGKVIAAILLLLFLNAVARAAGVREAFYWFLIIMAIYAVVLTIKWLWQRRRRQGDWKGDEVDLGDLRDIVED